MDVRIAQPLGYSGLGSRSNNEDSIFPDPDHVSIRQKWFLVCDGVGGAERGEVASKLAVTSLDAFLYKQAVPVPTDDYLQQAILYVEEQFNIYFKENPQASGMATTMTMLYLHEAGATVAHIGDSRVYLVREGKVFWRTDDHSYVNELVKAGVLTPSEAHRHPQRNIITRALQGGEKPVHASVQIINDLRPGDYFFLCSDGVLERVSDELLEGTLGNNVDSNEQKLAKLKGYSLGNTRDNFTAYLIQIEQATGSVDPKYQFALPIYIPHSTEADTDETITLINVPVPEEVKPEPITTPVKQEKINLPNTDSDWSEPNTLAPTSTRATNEEIDRATVRRQVQPQRQPQKRSSNLWATVTLALVGVLIGVFGIIIWQKFFEKKAEIRQSGKQDGQPSKTQMPPVNLYHKTDTTPAKITGEPDKSAVAEEEVATDSHANNNSPTPGLSVGNLKKSLTPTPTYDVVQRVDNQLSIVKDKTTKLFGLRKDNGQRPAAPIYSKISSFQNGFAEVTTDKGPEKYISKEGGKYKAVGEFTNGFAKVVDMDGKESYFSKDGKKYKEASPFTDGVTKLIDTDGKTSYLSTGKVGIWFDEAKPASNGKVAVRKGKLWGYLNLQGDLSIRVQYTTAESFKEDGTAEVTEKGKKIRIDKDGKPVREVANSTDH